MPAIVRSLSFSRRARSKPTAEVSKTSEVNVESVGASLVKKLVRSSSFGRRKNRPTDEPVTREESESSDSRASSPTTDQSKIASPSAYDEPRPPPVLSSALYGWLHKSHNTKKSWARRYFWVDESSGTIAYAKTNSWKHKSKPSTIMPLADISAVVRLDGSGFVDDELKFKISCPPLHLTVRALDRHDLEHWLEQLQLRVDMWKVKASAKVRTARVSRQPSSDSNVSSNVSSARSSLSPSEPAPLSPPQPAADVEDEAWEEAAPAHASAREMEEPMYRTAAGVVPPESRAFEKPMYTAAGAVDGDACDHLADSPPVAQPARVSAQAAAAQWAASEPTPTSVPGSGAYRHADAIDAIETVEFESEDESAEPSPAAAKGRKTKGVTPVGRPARARDAVITDFASMLSSDEDEDCPDQRPAVARARAAPKPAPRLELAPRVVESPPRAAAYDDEMDDIEDVAAMSPPSPEELGAISHRRDEAPEPVPYEPNARPSPVEAVRVGDGIVADANFVDDDWDDDDDE